MFGPIVRRLFRASSRPARFPRTARLGLDLFEDRVVPASVSFINGILVLQADQSTADTIRITPVGAMDGGSTGVKVLSSLTGPQAVRFGDAAHPVTAIALDLKDGNDQVEVASLRSVLVIVGEGNGNNVVRVGDTLAGGVIAGAGRNDITVGSATWDAFGSFNLPGMASSVVFVGWGYQFANGGTAVYLTGTTGNAADNDIRMRSEAGSHSLVDLVGTGDNRVRTGAGDDGVSIIGGGDNRVNAGEGNDLIYLTGGGDNHVIAGTGWNTVQVSGNGDNRVTSEGTGTVTVIGTGRNKVDVGSDPNNTVSLWGAGAGSTVSASSLAAVYINGILVTGSGTFDDISVVLV